jgi:SAM-dependent methyltransferase
LAPAELGHLERLRQLELQLVAHHFRPGMRVLELGGGNGFQAAILSSWGCEVESIDIPQRGSSYPKYYPVQDYDGWDIPFPERSFDAVFSSNVLEHIAHLPQILAELRRVLVGGGVAIHVLPSSGWRLWTSVTHYPGLVKRFADRRRMSSRAIAAPVNMPGEYERRGAVRRVLYSGPHGEYPSAFSELYYYSRRRWVRVFTQNGFAVVEVADNNLFYTGNEIFPGAPLGARKKLSRVLGSACNIFLTRVMPGHPAFDSRA